ncbi:MAG: hypothetical protein JW700_03845 [Candidatus Aenigmarchaeota archaeon]|nr:hypothetical protein [Candidatus Aenigmarchaeota archaeon]
MKGVSSIIVAILLLIIAVSMTSLAYSFFGEVVSETTETGNEVVEEVKESTLSNVKIDSISDDIVTIRNTGKVDISHIAIFVNDMFDAGASVPYRLSPGSVGDITLSEPASPGAVIKVTTGEGASAIRSVPGTFLVLLDASFDSDAETFSYQDNLFGTSSNTAQENGQWETDSNCASGACLAVELNVNGPPNNENGGYSGGWQKSITTTGSSSIKISFDYRLRLAGSTELNEYVNVSYIDIEDGSIVMGPGIVHSNPGSDEYRTGSITYTTGLLAPGTYSFGAGCYMTQVTATNENSGCWIDNVLIETV